MALVLLICEFPILPEKVDKVYAAENSSPSVSAFATTDNLKSTFTPGGTIGKLKFGKKQVSGSSFQDLEWYILGQDADAGNNTVIFAGDAIATDIEYGNHTGNIEDLVDFNGKKMYPNAYGPSELRSKLIAISANSSYFNQVEQSIMQATSISNLDYKGANGSSLIYYSTEDKLYAPFYDVDTKSLSVGSNNGKTLSKESCWNDGNDFWSRSPHELYTTNSYSALSGADGKSINTPLNVRPASKLNLESVLFASSAEARETTDPTIGTITSGSAMTLRLKGSTDEIGTVRYDSVAKTIKVEKGSSDGATLVVQGNTNGTDWYYSQKIAESENISAEEIMEELTGSIAVSDLSLSTCKIWLEIAKDNMKYAVLAEEAEVGTYISEVTFKRFDEPVVGNTFFVNAWFEGYSMERYVDKSEITWTDAYGKVLESSEKAQYASIYTASITLTAKENVAFSKDVVVYTKGQKANVISNTGKTITVTRTYTTPAKPKQVVYATKEEMMTKFTPDEDGNAEYIGKLKIAGNYYRTDSGEYYRHESYEWYILGQDKGVMDNEGKIENTSIFLDSYVAMGTEFITDDFTPTAEIGTYSDGSTYTKDDVAKDHYGASKLRVANIDMSNRTVSSFPEGFRPFFSDNDRAILQATPIQTYDTKNNKYYTTEDVLYSPAGSIDQDTIVLLGSDDGKKLSNNIYWNDCYSSSNKSSSFWLRTPYQTNDGSFSVLSVNKLIQSEIVYIPNDDPYTGRRNNTKPASNINLSSVLFASAVIGDYNSVRAEKISDRAMALRMDGKGKNIGTVVYDDDNGIIRATKGSVDKEVFLIVQGNDPVDGWYYSEVISGEKDLSLAEIQNKLKDKVDLTGIKLSDCHIWLEIQDDVDWYYAVMATESDKTLISKAEIMIDAPIGGETLDTTAGSATKGLTGKEFEVKWQDSNNKTCTIAKYNEAHTATITVTPDSNASFSSLVKATVNGNSDDVTATLSKDKQTLTVKYTFPATAKRSVSQIAITGIDAPVGGGKFDATAVTATEGIAEKDNLTVSWKTASGASVGNVVQYNQTYKASVTLTPTDDAEFASDNIKATINGNEATVVRNADSSITVTIEFTTEKWQINEVGTPKVPGNNRFVKVYTKETVLRSDELGNTVQVTLLGTNDSTKTVTMNITWSVESYDESSFAENTFKWKVTDSKLLSYSYGEDVQLEGTVTIRNVCTEHHLVLTKDETAKSVTVRCSICGDEGTVKMTISDKVYDGAVSEAKIETTGFMAGTNPVAQVNVSYKCGEESVTECKDAKNYTAVLTVTAGEENAEIHQDFTISKRGLSIRYVQVNAKVYDATKDATIESVQLDNVVELNDSKEDVCVIVANLTAHTDQADVYYQENGNTGYHAGTVIVQGISLAGEDCQNYKIDPTAVLLDVWYVIYPATVTITPEAQELSGNDLINQEKYTVSGLDPKFSIQGIELYENQIREIAVKTDKIKIMLTGEEGTETDVTKNFSFETKTAKLTRECTEHKYENGFCIYCDAYQPAVIVTSENKEELGITQFETSGGVGVAIYNAGQLYWFAQKVNSNDKIESENMEIPFTSLPAILMDDITVNKTFDKDPREWTPIVNVTYSYYSANFYGNDHSVSGLYCIQPEGYTGLFGSLGYYVVSDLYIKNSQFQGKYVGGIAGYSNGATIQHCSVGEDVIITASEEAGGLIGNTGGSGTIKNCYSRANITGKLQGGLVGKNYARIENCYTNNGNVVGINNASYGGSFSNVYFQADTEDGYDGTIPVTKERFQSGEITYLLQSNVQQECTGYDEEGYEIYTVPKIWYQTLAGENQQDYPSFHGEKVYRCCYDENKYTNTNHGHIDEDKNGRCDHCGKFVDEIGAHLAGYTLSLNGNIGVNFYMELDQKVIDDPNSYYMSFTLPNGKVDNIDVSKAEQKQINGTGTTYYVFSCEVASNEMSQQIHAQMFSDDGDKGTEYVYTVRDYAEYIIQNDYTEADKKFAAALLNYGACSQNYFNKYKDDLANKNLSEESKKLQELTADDLETYALKFKETEDSSINAEAAPKQNQLGEFRYSLVLNTETSLKVYFKPFVEIEDLMVTIKEETLENEEGTAQDKPFSLDEFEKNGSFYVFRVDDIKAWDLDKNYTFTVSNGSISEEFTCCGMSYGYSVLSAQSGTYPDQLLQLISSLYTFNQAAKIYDPNSNNE